MFLLQKFISNILISPGIFIIILLMIFMMNLRKRSAVKGNFLLLVTITAIYLLSIEPVKDMVVQPLEKNYPPITRTQLEEADCYVVLGGGIYDNAPKSLSSVTGSPGKAALFRVVEGVRLYKNYPKKIIITGGIVYNGEKSEGRIYKELMVDLGVPGTDIIIEGRSKTTEENARLTKGIMEKNGYKKAALITSATHMKRSKYTFEKYGAEVIPAPTGYVSRYKGSYGMDSYFPNAGNFVDIRSAVWEYIGLIFYKIKS
ncbi:MULTISPECIES: YdcF family protein [Psychrilyobacter]|uniref:YdcF family protein n=1 Tax=Psychrilyobacter piezotolerans TaxID=2293438 RepID=A0ABX9KHH3_9FUSO|nr:MULTISPECIES: YdcF family protein [Psychrilyobacter]MCS5422355.1 YdcF family protein [Psychrilyobacter sp. S5]NDI78040.1 YdcF family protein [Psychrilyobacter piezotolerans]RDE61977.1 YdcF family protein [Psychrilyobacter sp. S5]REI41203.1 YdcF family protein [Psychrilyobacter piezotolerans]